MPSGPTPKSLVNIDTRIDDRNPLIQGNESDSDSVCRMPKE